MPDHLPCYGKLFPSHGSQQAGTEPAHAVFGYLFAEPGTLPRLREITVNLAAWDRCLECRDFSTCQQLSAAKVLLEIAVRN
jgi:hypothetical protein